MRVSLCERNCPKALYSFCVAHISQTQSHSRSVTESPDHICRPKERTKCILPTIRKNTLKEEPMSSLLKVRKSESSISSRSGGDDNDNDDVHKEIKYIISVIAMRNQPDHHKQSETGNRVYLPRATATSMGQNVSGTNRLAIIAPSFIFYHLTKTSKRGKNKCIFLCYNLLSVHDRERTIAVRSTKKPTLFAIKPRKVRERQTRRGCTDSQD